MTPFLPGPQTINVKQLENSIAFSKAELDLHEKRLEAFRRRGDTERSALRHLYSLWTGGSVADDQPSMRKYLECHRIYWEAQCDIDQLQIAQMKSKVAILEAMLEETKKPNLYTPGIDKQ